MSCLAPIGEVDFQPVLTAVSAADGRAGQDSLTLGLPVIGRTRDQTANSN